MALIKFGGGVAAISGKIAGTVYARNKAGAYARNWAKPTSTPTPQQTANRVRFGAQSAAWAALSVSNKNNWEGLAAGITRINRFGEPYTPTGRQIFLESNNNQAQNGMPLISAAPAVYNNPAGPAAFAIGTAIGGGVITTLTISYAVAGGTLHYIAEATPLQSDAKNNVTNLFRYLGTFPGAALDTDLEPSFTALFGSAAVAGQILWLRTRILDASTGLASAPLVQIATL